MRILLVTPMPPRIEAPGAIPIVLDAQVAGLRDRHELTIVTVAGYEPGELEAVETARASGLEVVAVDARQPSGVAARWHRRWRLATTWMRTGSPWRTVWFAHPALEQVVDRLARTRRFDVVAVEDNSMGSLRLPANVPAVLTEHEVRRSRPVDWHCGRPSRWPQWAFQELDWRRWPEYERRVWRQFEVVQVFSSRDADAVERIAPEVAGRVRVTPFGIELPEPADPAREQRGVVLFVGNFTHPPNVHAARWLVNEIMPTMRAQAGDVCLRLVGSSPPRDVRSLSAPDVEVVGEVPTIARELEAAAVVLAPVRTGGGMRMKVLRALAAGKAVVTTPRGAEGFTLGSGDPPLVVAESARGIAEEATKLLGDAERRRALGKRAIAFVTEHYSADAYGRRLEATYQDVVSRRQSIVDAKKLRNPTSG